MRAIGLVQGWDQAHQQAAAEGKAKQEVTAAGLAEMCQRAQDLGQRFYPNEVMPSPHPLQHEFRVLTKGTEQPSTTAQGWGAMVTYIGHRSQNHGLALHTQ